MYKEARAGLRSHFTGIQQDYEAPENPDIVLNTDQHTADECAEAVIRHLFSQGLLF
jgi:adenylylsulfate kinase-like enzyme